MDGHTPPPIQKRRRHVKSRDGCLQCKHRKIKCDENGRIKCHQCTKSRQVCSFEPDPPPPPPINLTFSSTTLFDFELLHNFSTKTAKSLTDSGEVQSFFSVEFVQLALRYHYLLHSLLALSAFHIAHELESTLATNSQDSEELMNRYLLAAYLHHDIAIKGYRESLSDVNSQTCHPIFGCACLLFMTTLARPREHDNGINRVDTSSSTTEQLGTRLSEWIILIRGIPSILSHNESLSLLREGPMAILMRSREKLWMTGRDFETMDSTAASHLNKLSEAIDKHSEPKTTEVCQSAIERLREAMGQLSHPNDAVLAFMWPMRLHPEFFGLLEQQKSEALLVFAYYCVGLHTITSRWWLKDWPRSMLKSVRELIEEKWLPMLEWPLQTVFSGQKIL